METLKFKTCSPIEGIIFDAFKGNQKVIKASFKEEFRNKSLRECLLIIKEMNELSEESLIRIIEETHEYHLYNYHRLQESINSYR